MGTGARRGLKQWQEGPHHRPVCVGQALLGSSKLPQSQLRQGAGVGGSDLRSMLHPELPLLGCVLRPDPCCCSIAGVRVGHWQPPICPPQPPSPTPHALFQHLGRSFLERALVWSGRCPWPMAHTTPKTQPRLAGCGICLGAVTQPCRCCLLCELYWEHRPVSPCPQRRAKVRHGASWGGASLVLSCPCTHGWTAGLCLGCPTRRWGLEAIRRGSKGGLGRALGVWPISGLVLVLTTVLFLSGGPGGL